MSKVKKFIFFGTPYVARDTLAALLAAGLEPVAVVTNPDAPRGRGQVLTKSETRVLAEEHNLPVITPARLDAEALAIIKSFDADFAVVVAYGKILPAELIAMFPQGVFNIHYSLLPKYRGATPVETALLQGETFTGVTIQKMVYELDAGDIVAQAEEAILPDDTTATLRPRLVTLGSQLLLQVWPAIVGGTAALLPQNHSAATFAPKLKKEDGQLDLAADGLTNWRKYQAFAEWSGTYFFENAKRFKVKQARFDNGRFIVERVVPEGGKEQDYRSV
jgi:methionyl-tRNA formyltransferase